MERLVQVIVLVDDLAWARRRVEGLGLAAVDGGRHPGRGTANVIVPFGEQYLELLAVVDIPEATASPRGRPVIDALVARGQGLARWSLETDDIDAASERLGLEVEHRQRIRPDGGVVRWRSVGVNESWVESWKCAFMNWSDPRTHPARTAVAHPCGATGFAQLDVGVPNDRAIRAWTGHASPDDVAFRTGGRPGPIRLNVNTPGGRCPSAMS
jgi:hypothetical protein